MTWAPKYKRRPWRDFLTTLERDAIAMYDREIPRIIGRARASMRKYRARIQARASARARRAGK